jgi:hypothetical protein
MTDPPKLYPGHQHQWAATTCGGIHAFGEECKHAELVSCAVCGFQVPRNLARLDGTPAQPEPPDQEPT